MRYPDISCFLLVLLSLATSIQGIRTRATRAHYNEYCDNRAIRCDSSLSLTCRNNTCSCLKPESMVYDASRRSCAALARETCKFTVMEEYRTWQEEVHCVTNAHCDFSQSICVCNRGYIELANGTCIPKKSYGETCDNSSDCKQDFSLMCKDSKCVCLPNVSEYSEEMNQCVGLADKPCVNDLCTANAICREEPRRSYYRPSVELDSDDSTEDVDEYAETLRDPSSIGRCQCRTAFGVTTGGRCQLGYGGKCDHQQAKCMSWLKCKEGTCSCHYPAHQIYDKNMETCLSRVGGPCTDPAGGSVNKSSSSSQAKKILCIPGTICTQKQETSKFQCSCPEGYIENKDRSCDLGFGQTCRTTTQYTSSRQSSSSLLASMSAARCDKIGKLYCIDARCRCVDELHAYDQTSRMCKGLVGAFCNPKNKNECITGTYCQERRGGEGQEGFCQCLAYYAENEDGTCSLPPALMAVKSGGGSGDIGEGWNVSSNSVWSIFDKDED
ncbi:unnamed protein product [Orchesella dallaii]|uniref:EGF-like domain-containing protein n=1 Tax=Orchesella dallaii TaxID=48710 RepID=A0ABP1R8L7_9HEXA